MRALSRERRSDREHGATLVEFAFALPLLLLLLLGIVEYGFVFSQQVEVRHAAREGARLAAVDFGTDADSATARSNIAAEICNRINFASIGSGVGIDIDFTTLDLDGDGRIEEGDGLEISITAPIRNLTSVLSWAVPDGDFESVVKSRIEQVPSWSDGTETC